MMEPARGGFHLKEKAGLLSARKRTRDKNTCPNSKSHGPHVKFWWVVILHPNTFFW